MKLAIIDDAGNVHEVSEAVELYYAESTDPNEYGLDLDGMARDVALTLARALKMDTRAIRPGDLFHALAKVLKPIEQY